ncbi:MAG: DUF1015 domain-containing protein, partial [Lachnospiraceae bacterium]|nr:DUF1015 domain-containing protein [Lachnospiraceae bacterium]
ALPYDVYNRAEARAKAKEDALSFLNIDRPETQFAEDQDMYADKVYQKAGKLLAMRIADGTFVTERECCYYIYELIMDGRSQTGIVACASIDDYLNNVIKKHENTREEKELDRIRHVDACDAQTGPIFLAYRKRAQLSALVDRIKQEEKLYHFTSEDGITHNVWRVAQKEWILAISEEFLAVESIYIADGHHRAASAVKVGLKRREQHPKDRGTGEFNYFLSVLFPEEELMILPYNRVVRDLNGWTKEEFLARISENFSISEGKKEAVTPKDKGHFGMYLKDCWYELTAKPEILGGSDPVKSLDVTILQDYLLAPILGIDDPRTNKRIDFIGGIRGVLELERRVGQNMA